MSERDQFFSPLPKCRVCLKSFRDRRMLFGCFHTSCRQCFHDHNIGHSERDGCFECPICKQPLVIPKGSVDDFPESFFADSCLDAVAREFTAGTTGTSTGTAVQAAKAKVCNNSEEGDECDDAEQFCLDCCEQYCQHCSKFHRKTKATSKHIQVALDELTDEMLSNAISKLETPSCSKHKGESLKLYCSTCQCAVCSICCHIDHQYHTFKEMKDADEGLKANLHPLVQSIEDLKESVKYLIREVDKTTESYKKNASKARESIKDLFHKMQQMLSLKAAEVDQGICKKYDEAEALANSRSGNLVLNDKLVESLSSIFNQLASRPDERTQVEKLKHTLDDMLSAPEIPSHADLFAEDR